MNNSSARMTPDEARDLFFRTIRSMHPDAELSRAIDDAEKQGNKGSIGFQPNPKSPKKD